MDVRVGSSTAQEARRSFVAALVAALVAMPLPFTAPLLWHRWDVPEVDPRQVPFSMLPKGLTKQIVCRGCVCGEEDVAIALREGLAWIYVEPPGGEPTAFHAYLQQQRRRSPVGESLCTLCPDFVYGSSRRLVDARCDVPGIDAAVMFELLWWDIEGMQAGCVVRKIWFSPRMTPLITGRSRQ